jgi:hypothetical protein
MRARTIVIPTFLALAILCIVLARVSTTPGNRSETANISASSNQTDNRFASVQPVALPPERQAPERIEAVRDVPDDEMQPTFGTIPLAPSAEVARLSAELESSGPPSGAPWEAAAYDQFKSLIGSLATRDTDASLESYACHAGGCAATLRFSNKDGYIQARDEIASGGASAWPGPRTISPAVDENGITRALVILLPPTS